MTNSFPTYGQPPDVFGFPMNFWGGPFPPSVAPLPPSTCDCQADVPSRPPPRISPSPNTGQSGPPWKKYRVEPLLPSRSRARPGNGPTPGKDQTSYVSQNGPSPLRPPATPTTRVFFHLGTWPDHQTTSVRLSACSQPHSPRISSPALVFRPASPFWTTLPHPPLVFPPLLGPRMLFFAPGATPGTSHPVGAPSGSRARAGYGLNLHRDLPPPTVTINRGCLTGRPGLVQTVPRLNDASPTWNCLPCPFPDCCHPLNWPTGPLGAILRLTPRYIPVGVRAPLVSSRSAVAHLWPKFRTAILPPFLPPSNRHTRFSQLPCWNVV